MVSYMQVNVKCDELALVQIVFYALELADFWYAYYPQNKGIPVGL